MHHDPKNARWIRESSRRRCFSCNHAIIKGEFFVSLTMPPCGNCRTIPGLCESCMDRLGKEKPDGE